MTNWYKNNHVCFQKLFFYVRKPLLNHSSLVPVARKTKELTDWLTVLKNNISWEKCHVLKKFFHIGPTQVKCRLLISRIFYVMNFWHFLEMLQFNLWHFWIMVEFFYISDECRKCAENSDVRFYLPLWYQKVKFSAPIWCASESRRIQPILVSLSLVESCTTIVWL